MKDRWSVARPRRGHPGGRGGSGDLLADPNSLQAGAGEDDLWELPFLAVLLVLPDPEEPAQPNAVAFPIGGSQALPVDTAEPAGQGLGFGVPGVDRQRRGAKLVCGLVAGLIDQGFYVDLNPLQAGAGEDDLRELPLLAVLLVDSEEPAQTNAVAFPIGGSQALPIDTAVPAGQGLGLGVPGLGVDLLAGRAQHRVAAEVGVELEGEGPLGRGHVGSPFGFG